MAYFQRTKKLLNPLIITVGILSMIACSSKNTPILPDTDTENPNTAQVDFSKYIAIGNSLTAGMADKGLYLEGQKVAYPNLLAQQMKTVGGGTFESPFFSESEKNGSGFLRLISINNGIPELANVSSNLAIRGHNILGDILFTKYNGEINNYGVPGMRLDLATTSGLGSTIGNPYFERFLPQNQSFSSYESYTTNKNHSFFTFWLGSNDVLGYAMNGAVHDDLLTKLTSAHSFRTLYSNYIGKLTNNKQLGAVATIPDVTSIPYFTTITLNQILTKARLTNSQTVDIFIQTKQGVRKATHQDYFVLDLRLNSVGYENENRYGIDAEYPIQDRYVLDNQETIEVQNVINEYNTIIEEIAKSKSLALVNMHAFLRQVKDGLTYDGVQINAQHIYGGVFSLDGVHLTPRGNALVANLFIESINKSYRSSIPKLDISKYRGVEIPN